ncbi:MAG: hypothetical protein V1659_05215 [Candidatus Woesearchaeota archaeon]
MKTKIKQTSMTKHTPMRRITPEQYFLRFAFPAYEACRPGQLGEEYEHLKRCFQRTQRENEQLTREELERIFPNAFLRLKTIAQELCEDEWSIDVLREYWEKGGHNKCVEAEQCKILEAIIAQKGRGSYIVEYQRKGEEGVPVKRAILQAYPGARLRVGDRVLIHYSTICQKLRQRTEPAQQ